MLHKMNKEAIDCPKCGLPGIADLETGEIVAHIDPTAARHGVLEHCPAKYICNMCGGTGCMDTPFSGSEPGCETCSGEGFLT